MREDTYRIHTVLYKLLAGWEGKVAFIYAAQNDRGKKGGLTAASKTRRQGKEWRHQLLTQAGRGRNRGISSSRKQRHQLLTQVAEEGMETLAPYTQVCREMNGDISSLQYTGWQRKE